MTLNEEIAQVGTISANGDSEIGRFIATRIQFIVAETGPKRVGRRIDLSVPPSRPPFTCVGQLGYILFCLKTDSLTSSGPG